MLDRKRCCFIAAAVLAAGSSFSIAGNAIAADQPDAAPLPTTATMAGGPAAQTDAGVGMADLAALELGEPFRSRAAGIELRPPAGATVIRQAGGNEVARFLYPQRGWDIRLAVTQSSKPIALSVPRAPNAPAGLLELTIDQLTTADPSAQVLEQDVKNYPPNQMAVIVVRHHKGTDRELLQEAIIPGGDNDFYQIQFTTQLDAAGGGNAAPTDAAKEQPARQMFDMMLGSVKLLDRQQLAVEQRQRLYRTEELYHELGEKRIKPVLIPQQVMRVIRDGRDVGFLVQTEQLATHSDHDGVEIDLRSHVEAEAPKMQQPAPALPGGQVVDLPKPASAAGTAAPATDAPRMVRVDRLSKMFVSFDRRHEDWSTQTRVDNGLGAPAVTMELGNSDMEQHEELDRSALADHQVADPNDPKQPPVRLRQKYTLSVNDYTRAGAGVPIERQLPPYYLPLGLAQILPRLLPLDAPSTYFFYSYVSDEHEVMARYIDVLGERQVVLDGKPVQAVAINDRIGVDGSPTTTYMTRGGKFLGNVSPGQKLVVLPSDAATINGLWHGANIGSDNQAGDAAGALKP